MKDLSPRSCCHCGKDFTPKYTTLQIACSLRCATTYAKREREGKEKAEREQTKARKKALETIPELTKVAQREFNAFIRARDRDQACICCGKPLPTATGIRSHGVDAGHYRSVGSASHLRFDERNVHAQLVLCNRWGAGRAVDYRIGLIARIGLAAVEALEASNTPHKWTREELRDIATLYRTKRRNLEKEQA